MSALSNATVEMMSELSNATVDDITKVPDILFNLNQI